MKRGKFIVVDGGEGSGKSTLLEGLKAIFPQSDQPGGFVYTREPGGTPIAEKIRSLILSEDLKTADGYTQFALFWAARADHIRARVKPMLDKGVNVICDRFDSSSYAYQIYAQGASRLEDLFFKMREVYLGDTVPDLYVYLRVSPEVGLARVASRNVASKEEANHFDERKVEFHHKLTEGFLKFLPRYNHRVINAEQPLDVVKAEFRKVVGEAVEA
jgi:dTMP kinase